MAEENTETEGAEATEAFPEYGFHAYTSLFPRLDKKSFAKLKDDIEATGGNHTPIMIYQNEVIDGRERYDACKALNIYPNTAELEEPEDGTGVDLMAYVISANLHRRHLTTSQRAIIAGRISTGKLGDNQHTEETVTVDDAATLLNIGKKSVERGRKVHDPHIRQRPLRNRRGDARRNKCERHQISDMKGCNQRYSQKAFRTG